MLLEGVQHARLGNLQTLLLEDVRIADLAGAAFSPPARLERRDLSLQLGSLSGLIAEKDRKNTQTNR